MPQEKPKRPDTPLSRTPIVTTSVTILDDLQKASVARLKAKREERKTNAKEGKGTQSGADKLQGLASLRNTLGMKTRKTK